jgi:hypothetical protein
VARIPDAQTTPVAGGFEQAFGIPPGAPPPPTAVATLGGAPTVSSTPGPGGGVALDSAGKLAVAATLISVFTADPSGAKVGAIWYRSDTAQICVQHDSTTIKRVTLT